MTMRVLIPAGVLLMALSALAPARAAEGYDNCSGFVDALPATIGTQGVWCLRADLGTALASGTAVTIAANNVVLDCNDFKLGGLAAGAGTTAVGVYSSDRRNTTVRNCSIRGFRIGVRVVGGGGHLIEDNRLDGNLHMGILALGDASIVRRNEVRNTGKSTNEGLVFGIQAVGAVDVLDNTVSGLRSRTGTNGNVFGIYTLQNDGSTVAGNRVRNLFPDGSGSSWGIRSYLTGRMALIGNDVVGHAAAGSTGIYCDEAQGRAKDNVVNGLAVAITGCGGADNTVNP